MEFLSIQEIYEIKAQRHDARAKMHEEGKHPPEYILGSQRKAEKWRAKAKALDDFNKMFPDILRGALDRLSADIAKKILNG